MYQKSFVHHIAKVVIDILFYLSVVCVILVPFVAKYIFGWIGIPYSGDMIVFTVMVALSGIGCVYILFHLKQMYSTLLVGNPFVDRNVSHFRKMAIACALIALIYVVKCFLFFTVATVIIAMIFVVGCLFCLTLKDLFKQAINFKTENELTI